MRLVRLSDGCWVNPADVQELRVNWEAGVVVVRMRDGTGHSVQPDYGRGIGATAERLRRELTEGEE